MNQAKITVRTDRGRQVSFKAVLEVQARPSGVKLRVQWCVDLKLRRERLG